MATQAQDFSYHVNLKEETVILTRCTNSIGVVTLPDQFDGMPVTAIASFAFHHQNLDGVIIPDTVHDIGLGAFDQCNFLTSVIIGNGITNIGSMAFNDCGGLREIYFHGDAPTINMTGALRAKGYYLPGTTGWSSLVGDLRCEPWPYEYWEWADWVDVVGYTGNGRIAPVPSVVNGKPVTSISGMVFADDSKLEYIIIPSNISNMEFGAFWNCSNLSSVHFEEGISVIGPQSFAYCTSLSEIEIPASVTNLDGRAFYGCYNLDSINVNDTNPIYSSMDGVVFQNDQSSLYLWPMKKGGHYTAPETVTSVGSNAFRYCTNLVSVTFPQGVTNIGEYAFDYCLNLEDVYFKGDAPDVSASSFSNSNFSLIHYLPGFQGWESTFSDHPTSLWRPEIQEASFTNGFGFNMNWASDMTVVVEACTNLNDNSWVPIETNTLAADSIPFTDPQWTNYPGRFYRLRMP